MEKEDVIKKIKETKILPLTNDYVFKRIFSKDECNSELKDLLQGILGINIQKVEVRNPEIPKNILDEKLARLDIKAKINDEITLDIERGANNTAKKDEVTQVLNENKSKKFNITMSYDEETKLINKIFLKIPEN